jgi:dolichyl-phosphate-mannose--protein O-mannosyl transferase
MTADARRIRRALLALIALGAVTHFAGLGHPRQVVFDEATFGKYVAAYCCTGERIFDVHPPHGKLLIAAAAKAGGFDGRFTFERIGLPYGDTPVHALRLMPALAGIAIAPLFLLLLLELGATFPIALLGGLMLALDNALLVETRIIVWDGMLVAATLGALVCFFVSERRSSLGWRLGAGALAGLAVGCKLTGLAAPGLIAVCLALGLGPVRGAAGRRLTRGAAIAAAAAAVYVAGWAAHFWLLTSPGAADGFYPTTGSFLNDLVAAHKAMFRENVNLAATHPDASKPWTWPWMKVVPYFWQGQGASIYMLGNPIVWWGTSVAFVSIVVHALILRPLGLGLPAPVSASAQPWLALLGYAIALVPLLPVGRVLFLYHYFTPLVFSLAFVLLWLDRAGWARPGGIRDQPRPYLVVLGLTAAGFLAVAPLTYGVSVGSYDEWLASVVRGWR